MFRDERSARPAWRRIAAALVVVSSALASAGALAAFAMAFFDGANPFEIWMMGLFVLGIVAAFPALRDDHSPIGDLLRPLFRLLGVLCFFGGVVMAPVWILGFSIILSKDGVTHEWFLSSLLWLPVYFGIPALMSGIGE